MSGCYKRVNFYDLCRLCAQNIQKNRIKIFEKDGEKFQLRNKIRKCLSLNIKEDDFLPKVVCMKCIKQLEICNAFREDCLNSESMLTTYFRNCRDTEEFKKSGKVYIKDINKPETSIPSTNTKDKAELMSKKVRIPEKTPHPIAPMFTQAVKKAIQPIPKTIVNRVIVNSNGEVINIPDQNIMRSSSKKKRQNIDKLDLTGDDDFPKVNVQEKESQSVIFPVAQYHNHNFTPQATYAQTPTNSVPTVIICSPPPPVPLLMNPPNSVNLDDLRPAPAPAPPKKKDPKESSVKFHTCEVCTKQFKRREHLYQHLKLHTGFRPYQCTQCKKSFVRKEHLLRHTILHSGEKNYACDICGRSFSRHDNLLKHIRTHNKESSFTCDVCQKSFLLKHHYDSHRNQKGRCFLAT